MSFISHSASTSSFNYAYRDIEGSTATSTSKLNTNQSSVMYTRDWRTALRTPPTYKIGNRTFRFNYHFALFVVGVVGLFVFFFYIRTSSSSSSDTAWLKNYASSGGPPSIGLSSTVSNINRNGDTTVFNATYPLTPAFVTRGGVVSYRIAMVADLDTNSKVTNTDGSTLWRSYLKKGILSYAGASGEVKIKWDLGEPLPLDSGFSLKGRGMELSELITYNGKLLTFDDRTGLVYELINDKPIPWVILLDGNGHNAKGFKSEWATVKQQTLFVGSMGKEWTTSMGDFENENPMYVKTVTPTGEIRSIDWSFNYKRMREDSQKIIWPGYMIHESGVWSEVHKKWFFLPRRCSYEKYNETRDEYMGCNVLISADERFTKINTVILDPKNTESTHGFSSFKFIPGTDDRFIIAIKSEELNGKTSTFITAFGIDGKTLLQEHRIETDLKYEGIDFI